MALEWEQLDLLDAIAEAEAEMKKEKLNNGRIELCKTWPGGVKNDCGVYVSNNRHFIAEEKRYKVDFNVVLSFPHILAEVDIYAQDYGCCSPLTADYALVCEPVYNTVEHFTEVAIDALLTRIERDPNLCVSDKKHLAKLAGECVEKAVLEME